MPVDYNTVTINTTPVTISTTNTTPVTISTTSAYVGGYTTLSEYFKVKSVTINPPYTTITWENGEITKCKCTDGDTYDIRKGIEICYLKRIFKDKSYDKQINKVANKGRESYIKKLKKREKAIQKKIKEVNEVDA